MNRYANIILVAMISVAFVACSVPRSAGPYLAATSTKGQAEKFETKSTDMQDKEGVRQESFKVDTSEDEGRLKVYNVIIGSFSVKANALKLKSNQQPEYNPIIVVNERGMFRVILVSYATYEQAKQKISEISDRFPDAWVLVQKK